jgi:hypothetical protein
MSGLLDFLQGASNSAAGAVSGPIDLINMGLLGAGLPMPAAPFGGSQWMRQQGLMRDPQNRTAGLLGEAVGGVLPIVAAAKAPQIARGLLQAGDNLRAPNPMNTATRGQAGAIVYHGSPHKFDKFDSSKIGTGEGAQAYGHGLYFADSPDVARMYKANNSRSAQFSYNGKPIPDSDELRKSVAYYLTDAKGDKDAVRAMFRPSYFTDNPSGKQFGRLLDRMDYSKLSAGSLYKVDLPDEHIAKMLDWDKPLSQQSEGVRKAMASLGYDLGSVKTAGELHAAAKRTLGSKQFSRMANEDIYFSRDLAQARKAWNGGPESLENYMNTGDGSWLRGVLTGAKDGNKSGGVAYKSLADKSGGFGQAAYQGGGQLEASRQLRELGIPGVRYFDGGSRGAGTGTSNYVVFPGNEGLLNILSRE